MQCWWQTLLTPHSGRPQDEQASTLAQFRTDSACDKRRSYATNSACKSTELGDSDSTPVEQLAPSLSIKEFTSCVHYYPSTDELV